MAEQVGQLQAETNRRPSLDIPWMRQWENQNDREHSTTEDSQTRLINIDYMTMLEELEFH